MNKYEVINEKGNVEIITSYATSLFYIEVVNSMLKAGYKIKKNGKNMTKKDISKELISIK